MTENRFAVDYAKLGTSACKKCKTKIAKGELRIAKISPSPFSEGDTMKVYHHVPCIFDTFLHARATTKTIESSTDLDGWINISPADREIISEQIKRVEEAKTNKSTSKSPARKKTKSAPVTTAPKQTKKAVTTEDDELTVDYDEIEKKTDDGDIEDVPATSDGVHVPINDDPKHPDNSFRQLRGLCTKIAEINGHLAKTAIVEEFITYGSDGKSYQGENIERKLEYC